MRKYFRSLHRLSSYFIACIIRILKKTRVYLNIFLIIQDIYDVILYIYFYIKLFDIIFLFNYTE